MNEQQHAHEDFYEVSCSRYHKQSQQSLYSDEETALKHRWEQHCRSQKLRLRKQRNQQINRNLVVNTAQGMAQLKKETSLSYENKSCRVRSPGSNFHVTRDDVDSHNVSISVSAQLNNQHTVRARTNVMGV